MLLTAEIKRQNLMKTATKALVIKEQTIGESDRLITLLSAEHGLIRAFVRRAKLAKSRSASATSLFAYGDFSLYRGKDAYTVDGLHPNDKGYRRIATMVKNFLEIHYFGK